MLGRKKPTTGVPSVPPSTPPSGPLSVAADRIAEVALRSVQTEDGGVRVEDYLTVLAAAAGEAVLVGAGLFDIENNELSPGAAVFGDRINSILTGDSVDLAEMSTDTVLGLIRAELVPAPIPPAALPDPRRLYEHVAASVNSAGWGYVALTVHEDNRPRVMPLRAAFEMRATVEAAAAEAGVDPDRRWVPCVLALCVAIRQVQAAIDMALAATIVTEVVFGMAKMVPMAHNKLT